MNKLYYKSPIFLQHVLTSIYGLRLKRRRYNKLYWEYYNDYLSNKIEPIEELESILRHLKDEIKYYNELNIETDNKIELLKTLPLTDKEDLRTQLNDRSSQKGKIFIVKTGGTTGKSLKVYSNENDRNSRMAYLDYIKKIHGVKPFSKRASFTGKEITPQNHKNILWRYNFPMNQTLYASFRLNKKNVAHIYKNLKKNKPVLIDGFPSAIHLVAKYILVNNIEISWKINAIFPTAETLTPVAKEEIEKAFKTKVIDQYASSEGAPFIFTDLHNNYTIGHETGLFEFIKVEENIYEMIVTSFINKATPIVRYKIGDRVIINSEEEYLNSFENNIKIEKILGRNTDYLLGEDDTMVTSVNLANAIKDLGNKIIQAQFLQKELNTITINLVTSDHYSISSDESVLIQKLKQRLGKKTYIFNYVEGIEKEKSGKTRFIINEMSEKK